MLVKAAQVLYNRYKKSILENERAVYYVSGAVDCVSYLVTGS